MLRRCFVFMIAAVSAIQYLASCGKNSDSPEQTTLAETVPPPAFENMDLGGDEFTFLVYDTNSDKYADSYIWSDISSGSAVDTVVAERNSDTESKFNIKIRVESVHVPRVEVAKAVQSGQVNFDVVYENGTQAAELALSGYLYDIDELPKVNLGRSYWVPTATSGLTIAGKTYLATNYISMNSIAKSECILYNKTKYDGLKTGESLYDIVRNKEWTVDKYLDLAVRATDDLDGNGIMTSVDGFGIWGDENDCLVSLSRGSGVTNTRCDENECYTLGMYDQRAIEIYTKFEERITDRSFIGYDEIWNEYGSLTAFPTRYEAARGIGFGGGHVLFMSGPLGMAEEFTDMTDDYGILPNPLGSSDQAEYYHYIDATAPLFAVPAGCASYENTGIILEYMAYKSEECIIPAFFAEAIGSNKAYDERDLDIFNIIRNSTRYEWTEVYGLNVTGSILKKMMTSGSFNSVYNRMSGEALAEVNEIYETLDSIK